ncbi:MAG: SUMF1/EgtB/PvdO family nonheme iron enzyme, partial [Thermoguttaceae bacterium]|nr:SUMF1/EgtB/PvdO family nonheme iron enzyme [Thermoguttaceae bacterium]
MTSDVIVRAQEPQDGGPAGAPGPGGFFGGQGMGGMRGQGGGQGMGGMRGQGGGQGMGGGPGMMGGFPGGPGMMGGFPGGPGMGMGGMRSGAVRKALGAASSETGEIDLTKFEAELTKILNDADNEDDGFLDMMEQQDAFGSPVVFDPNAAPGAGGPNGPQRGPNADGANRPQRGANADGSNGPQRGPNADGANRPQRGADDRQPGSRQPGANRGEGPGGFGRGGMSMFVPTPDDNFVGVPMDETFKFNKGATGKGAGEKSPIEKNYAIGKYEVRNREYKEFVDATKRESLPKYWVDGTYEKGTKNCPVVGVTLQDALDYCAWLETKYDGWTFRLPTEAEFEHAALGDVNTKWPWGAQSGVTYRQGALTTNVQYNGAVVADLIAADASTELDGKTVKVADIAKISATGTIADADWRDTAKKTGFTYSTAFKDRAGGFLVPVYKYRDNRGAYGAIGMLGNAAEWTSTVVDGKNVVRGGSWYSTLEECAATFRGATQDPTKAVPPMMLSASS